MIYSFDLFDKKYDKALSHIKENSDSIFTTQGKIHIKEARLGHIYLLMGDEKNAKSNYLIDDIKDLDEVINEIAKELKLKDYKVIEKEKNKSFFENILQTSLIFKYDINKIKKNRICK